MAAAADVIADADRGIADLIEELKSVFNSKTKTSMLIGLGRSPLSINNGEEALDKIRQILAPEPARLARLNDIALRLQSSGLPNVARLWNFFSMVLRPSATSSATGTSTTTGLAARRTSAEMLRVPLRPGSIGGAAVPSSPAVAASPGISSPAVPPPSYQSRISIGSLSGSSTPSHASGTPLPPTTGASGSGIGASGLRQPYFPPSTNTASNTAATPARTPLSSVMDTIRRSPPATSSSSMSSSSSLSSSSISGSPAIPSTSVTTTTTRDEFYSHTTQIGTGTNARVTTFTSSSSSSNTIGSTPVTSRYTPFIGASSSLATPRNTAAAAGTLPTSSSSTSISAPVAAPTPIAPVMAVPTKAGRQFTYAPTTATPIAATPAPIAPVHVAAPVPSSTPRYGLSSASYPLEGHPASSQYGHQSYGEGKDALNMSMASNISSQQEGVPPQPSAAAVAHVPIHHPNFLSSSNGQYGHHHGGLSASLPNSSSSSSSSLRTPNRSDRKGMSSSNTTGGHAGGGHSGGHGTSTPGYDQLFSPGERNALRQLRDPTMAAEVERAPEDNELVDLSYSQKIVLRSHLSFLASLDSKSNSLVAQTYQGQPFLLLNARLPSDLGQVRFQDIVFLVTENGHYLAAEHGGQVTIKKVLASTPWMTAAASSQHVPSVTGAMGTGAKHGNGGIDTTTIDDQKLQWRLIPAHAPIITSSLEATNGSSQTAIGDVKVYDTIALQSCLGPYMSTEDNGSINTNSGSIGDAQRWKIARASVPFAPDWSRRRAIPLTTSLGISSNSVNDDKLSANQLNALPSDIQEQRLLEDYLSLMIGIDGRYVKFSHNSDDQRFIATIHPLIKDRALVSLLQRLLPVCEHFAYLDHFVKVRSRFEFGLVNHAFVSSINTLLKEYLILVAQLEYQFKQRSLTFLKVQYWITRAIHTMNRLYRITSSAAASHSIGGSLLTSLYQTYNLEGDSDTRTVYHFLLTQASSPYFDMVHQWIHHGVIVDPYDEFAVKSKDELNKDNIRRDALDTYWTSRYSARVDKSPSFLEPMMDRIVKTGKYLNVIRECGVIVASPFATDKLANKLIFTTDHRLYSTLIDNAYGFASRELLNMLMGEKQLMQRLRSIKRYFLFDQGDFFVHFMDIAEDQLKQARSEIVKEKLDSLLELALRTSKAATDPYKDDLVCTLSGLTLVQKLDTLQLAAAQANPLHPSLAPDAEHRRSSAAIKGVESITFDYRVSFPLTLVLSKLTLTKYQMIFRLLFFCKHVERCMGITWRHHQSTKELNLRQALARSYALRQRMLHFLQNFSYYIMVEVLEPSWHHLEEKLATANTVDEVLLYHDAFLDKCLRECLLSNLPLLKNLMKLVHVCLLFAEQIERFTRSNQTSNSLHNDEGNTNNNMGSSTAPPATHKRRGSAAIGVAVDRKESLTAIRQTKIDVQTAEIRRIVADESYIQMIERQINTFDTELASFIGQLRDKSQTHYEHHFTNLFHRLDYNLFYSNYFDAKTRKAEAAAAAAASLNGDTNGYT